MPYHTASGSGVLEQLLTERYLMNKKQIKRLNAMAKRSKRGVSREKIFNKSQEQLAILQAK